MVWLVDFNGSEIAIDDQIIFSVSQPSSPRIYVYTHTQYYKRWTPLNTLANSGKQVTLQWVRGHNNTAGNEYADSMAKTGATLQVDGPEPFLPLSKAVCRKAAHNQLLYLWNDKWQRVIDYRQTKICFPAPDNSQTKNLLRQTRKDLGPLVRHITGFSKLNYPSHSNNKVLVQSAASVAKPGRKVNT
jgi:hypothetical protein